MNGMWRRLHSAWGWWLIVIAAVAAGILSAVSSLLPAVAAAVVVATGSAVAAVIVEHGKRSVENKTSLNHQMSKALFIDARGRLPLVRELDDPVLVGVHPAARRTSVDGDLETPPPFVWRDRSAELESAIRQSGFVLVVGESTAGKTRAAFEAIRARLPNHRFIRPRGRTAIPVLVTAVLRERRCVVWLDDLEQYLGTDGLTADLIALMIGDDRREVTVIATLRAQERARCRARSTAGDEPSVDEVARAAGQVLNLATEIRIDRRWSASELDRARAFANDDRIASALMNADRFGVAEYLAAAPQLLAEWRDAWAPNTHPRCAAIVAAAVDARRAGYHNPLPLEFFREVHGHYLAARGGARLRPETWDEAMRWALTPLHATSSLLVPDDEQKFLAFDYLHDAVDSEPDSPSIPNTTWQALIRIADPALAADIGWTAVERKQSEHATAAFQSALERGHALAAIGLAYVLSDEQFRHGAAAELLRETLAKITTGEIKLAGPAELLRLKARLAWHSVSAGVRAEFHIDHRTTERITHLIL